MKLVIVRGLASTASSVAYLAKASNFRIIGPRFNPHQRFWLVVNSFWLFYRPQRSWGKVIFSEACVKNSVHGGGGMRGCWQGVCVCWQGGHAWLQGRGMCGWQGGVHGCWGCVCGCQGGMHGCQGVCMAKGGAWLLGGVCGCWGHVWWRGCAWWSGVCVVKGGGCMGYDEIRRYDQWAGGTHPTGMHSCDRSVVIGVFRKST